MSMRSQVYEWSNLAPGTVLNGGAGSVQRRSQNDLPVQVPANQATDIFIGGVGNNITKPAETTATQFIVIEDISCTPDLAGSVQVRINTTDYFQNPDVTQMNGVPGIASPYPRGMMSVNPTGPGVATPAGVTLGNVLTVTPDNLLKSFDLYPDVYVLPGQVFQILYTTPQGTGTTQFAASGTAGKVVSAFVKYTLYDGPDALIANKLLELGVTINPNNIDWYKRSLIEQQTRSAVAAAAMPTNGGA